VALSLSLSLSLFSLPVVAVLDVHQDAVGTAMCGEGVPMWFTQVSDPHLILTSSS